MGSPTAAPQTKRRTLLAQRITPIWGRTTPTRRVGTRAAAVGAPFHRCGDGSNLFLALFPDRYSATQLTRYANGFCEKFGLSGTPLKEPHFHVSLYRIFDVGALKDVAAAADHVAGAVPPFDVWFDRVISFHRSGALVLRSDRGNTVLMQFRDELGVALKNCGVRYDRSNFHPHITLLYDDRTVLEEAVDPVSWVANRFVLVRSFLGQTRYETLGSWSLRG